MSGEAIQNPGRVIVALSTVILISALSGAIAWMTWMTTGQNALRRVQDANSTKLAAIEASIEGGMSDRHTLTMASEQALRTAVLNPGMRVPDPRNPGQHFDATDSPPFKVPLRSTTP